MMADSGNNKDWPTLNDSNVACASSKSKHQDSSKEKARSKQSSSISRTTDKNSSNNNSDITDAANGLPNACTSTYSKNGARKKQSGKTKWSPVHIDLPSYRDNRNERNYNESHRFASGRRYNEAANNITNGHDNGKGRAFRGGRGGRGQYRYRRDAAANSDSRRYNSFSQQFASSQGNNINRRSPAFRESLKAQIRGQIEYYFSAANLVRDTYLRCHMDEQGYADIKFIAEFPRISRLTDDMSVVLNAVKESSHLEVSEDTKIRPVVDPLRWPLKPIVYEHNAVSTGEHFVDMMSAQFYNLSIDPSVYHSYQGSKSHLPGEPVWSYIPVGDIYAHPDTNYLGAAAATGLEIANGHISPPEQHSPNSDYYCEFPSHFIPNGTEYGAVPEAHVLPNGVSDIPSDSNLPNGQTCSTDQVPPPCNGEFSSHDMCVKAEESFHPLNGNNASTCGQTVSNGLECSADLRHMSEMGAYDGYFGPSGVIMYNSGGHYYVAHSTEVLANSTDSSDEKSTLHNKSPEPPR